MVIKEAILGQGREPFVEGGKLFVNIEGVPFVVEGGEPCVVEKGAVH